MGIKLVTGSRYLGGFFGERESEESWLAEKLQGWKESVKTLSRVDRKYLQSAYAGLQKSLQQEWTFLQKVTPDIGDNFGPVEQALRDTLIPALFQGLGEGKQGRGVTCLSLKQAVLALPDPTKTAPEKWHAVV